MSFIGNTPTQQAFTPAVDYFSGNGATTAFTLSRPVASVAQVEVIVNNVAQNPSDAYTINGNTITFTGAPSTGTNNIYVRYTSPITQVIQPGQATVGTLQLVDASVTTAKLSSTTGTGAVALASLPSFPTTLGVGGATASASGSGVTFPATQSASSDANTLDDYEEGTWTPVFNATGSNPTITYVQQQGYYVKIGALVYFTCRISTSSVSGGSGSLRLGGLPFPENAGSAGWYPASEVGYKSGWLTNGPDYGRVVGTNNELYKSNNTAETTITTSNLVAGTDFILTGVYNA